MHFFSPNAFTKYCTVLAALHRVKTCTYRSCCCDVLGLSSFLTCAFKSSSSIPAKGIKRQSLAGLPVYVGDMLAWLLTTFPTHIQPPRRKKKVDEKLVFCLLSSKLVLILSLFVRQPEGGGEEGGGRLLCNHSTSNVLFGSQVSEVRWKNWNWLLQRNTLFQLFSCNLLEWVWLGWVWRTADREAAPWGWIQIFLLKFYCYSRASVLKINRNC